MPCKADPKVATAAAASYLLFKDPRALPTVAICQQAWRFACHLKDAMHRSRAASLRHGRSWHSSYVQVWTYPEDPSLLQATNPAFFAEAYAGSQLGIP